MQRLFDISFPSQRHVPSLKRLWSEAFGDSDSVINHFFEKTVSLENVICAFCDDEPVSALYMIDSQVHFNNRSYKAYYVYAVCTEKDFRGRGLSTQILSHLEHIAAERGVSYLFLAPAEDSLFSFYKKLGYEICFTYKENAFECAGFSDSCYDEDELSFNKYVELKGKGVSVPFTTFSFKGFNGLCTYVESSMGSVSLKNGGYAIYENENGRVTVHECVGDRVSLLSRISGKTGKSTIYVREPSDENGKPYGMLKALDGSPLFYNGFLGVSYGG